MNNINLSGNPNELYRVPGAPDPNVIAKINKQAQEAFINAGDTYAVVEGANQASNEFPYRPFVNDSYDNIAQLKYQISRGNYRVPFEKVDAEYLFRQRAQVENADYDRWVMQKYDLTNPAQNMLLQKLDPDQFKRRMDLLKKQIALESRYAEVRMLGAKSEEDLKLEWLIETGRIQMPEGPLWDPQRWMENQMQKYELHKHPGQKFDEDPDTKKTQLSLTNRQRFTSALFSPLRFPGQAETGWQSNRNNFSDIRGFETYPALGQLFGGTAAANPYTRFGQPPIIDNVLVSQDSGKAGLRYGVGFQNAVETAAAVPEQPEIKDASGAVIQHYAPAKPATYGFAPWPPMSVVPSAMLNLQNPAYKVKAKRALGYGNMRINIDGT